MFFSSPAIQSNAILGTGVRMLCAASGIWDTSLNSLVIYSTPTIFLSPSAPPSDIKWLVQVRFVHGSFEHLAINIPRQDFPSSSKSQFLPSAQSNLQCFSKHLSDLSHPVLESISTHYYISLVKSFGIKNGQINPWAQTIVSIPHVCLFF